MLTLDMLRKGPPSNIEVIPATPQLQRTLAVEVEQETLPGSFLLQSSQEMVKKSSNVDTRNFLITNPHQACVVVPFLDKDEDSRIDWAAQKRIIDETVSGATNTQSVVQDTLASELYAYTTEREAKPLTHEIMQRLDAAQVLAVVKLIKNSKSTHKFIIRGASHQ